jgi:hypothetical protein
MVYKELFNNAIKAYTTTSLKTLQSFIVNKSTSTDDLLTVISLREKAESNLNLLKQRKPVPFTVNVDDLLTTHFYEQFKSHQSAIESAKTAHDTAVQKLTLETEHQKHLEYSQENNRILPVKELHKELLSYKDKLHCVLTTYNITPTDVKVSDTISLDEFRGLLSTAIEGCKALSVFQSNSVPQKVISLLRSDTNKSLLKVTVVLLSICFAAPILLTGYIILSVRNIILLRHSLPKLRVAESLMFDVSFDKFLNLSNTDTLSADTSDLDRKLELTLAELEKDNPQHALDKERRELQRALPELQNQIDTVNKNVSKNYNDALLNLQQTLQDLKNLEQNLKSKLKKFGTYVNDKPVLDLNFTLGRERNVIEQKYKVALQNVIFNMSTPNMSDYVKLFVCNFLLGVKVRYSELIIYDPENLGMEYAELFQNTGGLVKVYAEGFDALFKELRTYAGESIKLFGKSSIQEYNEKCCSVQKITRDYKFVLILSDAETVFKTNTCTQFLEYSATTGVFILMCYRGDTPKVTGVFHCEHPYTLPETTIKSPFIIAPTILSVTANTLANALADSRIEPYPYTSVFRNTYIPKEKYWSYSSNRCIELHFGLEQGDPEKGYPITVNNENIHILMGGMSGSGKSAALNQMLISLLLKYSPKELELVMVDFKRMEFEAFADPITKYSRIPHARILAGTTDGEYSLSVFEYIQTEMRRRGTLFGSTQVKNIEEYNNKLASETKRLPRILVIIDEFQVMFTEVDPRTVDKIRQHIVSVSKLGRAAGVHLWFTSQSMQGTMSKDILDQFSVRAALNCSPDVQQTLIGSSKLYYKTKVGWVWTNEHGGNNQSSTKLWKIPYASTKDVQATLDTLSLLCKQHSMQSRNALFYDEDKQYTSNTLVELYTNHPEFRQQSRTIFLGERTSFSTNNAPVNFNLTTDDGENVFIYAEVPKDLFNLCLTFADNILAKNDSMLLIHSADTETLSIINGENLVKDEFKEMCSPTFGLTDWIELLTDLIETRRNSNLAPIYIIAIQWEKYRGVGRNQSRDFDKFRHIIQDAPSAGIHFIFASKALQDLPRELYMNCNHRVCAKADGNSSVRIIDSEKAARIKESDFAIYRFAGEDVKFKIYQHTLTKQLAEREIVL